MEKLQFYIASPLRLSTLLSVSELCFKYFKQFTAVFGLRVIRPFRFSKYSSKIKISRDGDSKRLRQRALPFVLIICNSNWCVSTRRRQTKLFTESYGFRKA